MGNNKKISRFFKELKQLFDITNVYVGKSTPQKTTLNAANFLQTDQKSFDTSENNHASLPISSDHQADKSPLKAQEVDNLSKDLNQKLEGLSFDKLTPANNDISEIQKHNQQQLNALTQNYRNRLKAVVEKSKESEKQFKQELNDKFTTLMAQKKKAYRREVQKYHEIIVRLRETISRQRLEAQKLRRDHDTWVDELQLLRLEHEDLQDKYQDALAEHQETKKQLTTLQSQQEEAVTSENNVVDFDMLKALKEQIQESEALIEKQSATENELRAEINELKSSLHDMGENSAEQLVSKLNYLGIVGVCYQPGDGHLTIPAEQLISFVKDPGTYTVTHSGVSEDVYKSWLSHVNEPKCNAILPNGQVCGESVETVGDPLSYQRGISDRCSKHKRKEFTIAINAAAK